MLLSNSPVHTVTLPQIQARDWSDLLSKRKLDRDENVPFNLELDEIEKFLVSSKANDYPALSTELEKFMRCLFEELYMESLIRLQGIIEMVKEQDTQIVDIVKKAIFCLRVFAENEKNYDAVNANIILEKICDKNLPAYYLTKKKPQEIKPQNKGQSINLFEVAECRFHEAEEQFEKKNYKACDGLLRKINELLGIIPEINHEFSNKVSQFRQTLYGTVLVLAKELYSSNQIYPAEEVFNEVNMPDYYKNQWFNYKMQFALPVSYGYVMNQTFFTHVGGTSLVVVIPESLPALQYRT